MTAEYDTVIVGAGSSGAALAARLSEQAGRSVLLLEAGASYDRLEDFPADIRNIGSGSTAMPGHPANWSMQGVFLPGNTTAVPRGKIIGGSSSVNGAYFIRGTRADFDSWARMGNEAWSFEQVLPYFKKSETDQDFSGDLHGSSGPVPVFREPIDRAPEFTAAFEQACVSLGFPQEKDKNGDEPCGVGPVPMNISNGLRMSTALTYLLPNLGRSNLTVQGDTLVRRILLVGNRAVGVETIVRGEIRNYFAQNVVISAGAFKSPQLLMLSGIGPASMLRKLGIDVVLDLAGVGQNLIDHPELVANYIVDPEIASIPGRGSMTSALHWTAEGADRPGGLEILPMLKTTRAMINPMEAVLRRPLKTLAALKGISLRAVASQAVMRGSGSVVLGLLQEESRGEVTLASADPADNPKISYNFLSTDVDRRRFRDIATVFAEVFSAQPMAAIGGRTPDLNRATLKDQKRLDEWVRKHLMIAGHPTSTCRMGPDGDEMAVVDQYGRVRGIEGLRIADTSIWPMVPSRGPNASAIMTGERMAAFLQTGDAPGQVMTMAGADSRSSRPPSPPA